ncbi:RNA ligase family protein [Streptomyces goshikiensis]|uniref:RNA ligase family protein n=1 Tax=Streptomyces goshikiensis TaxID=1942 RepID=UPI00367A3DE1
MHYLEVYGDKIGQASRQYTGGAAVGYRLFDIATFEPADLDRSLEAIASWQDACGQRFHSEDRLVDAAVRDVIPLTPRLATVKADDLPADIQGMQDFLRSHLTTTLVALDEQAAGRPEGIVLRTTDRSGIAKARFKDYERTLGGDSKH